jgi:hypothetical protein
VGNKGQYIYISPQKRVIIVRNGFDFGLSSPQWAPVLGGQLVKSSGGFPWLARDDIANHWTGSSIPLPWRVQFGSPTLRATLELLLVVDMAVRYRSAIGF